MAQNQHYVPQFILRQFLSNQTKGQVTVYDKHDDRVFTTSTKNVMAETKFNDFVLDEKWIASFEPIASTIESAIFPRYNTILETQQLEKTPQERVDLSALIAFQAVRTKSHRERMREVENAIRGKVESLGGSMEDIEGWAPLTEDRLKQSHLSSVRDLMFTIVDCLVDKVFLLLKCKPGRSFYLGDNPVCLHNMKQYGPYGNLGFGVKGIEVYMPLSSNLLLAAWCPSVLEEATQALQEAERGLEVSALDKLMKGEISHEQMKSWLEHVKGEGVARPKSLLACIERGTPIDSDDDNMDFINSMQTGYAHRYLVCQKGDFELARRFSHEFPELKKGRKFVIS